VNLDHIRNFCIVAHIDHGKSTLADRLIEETGMLQKREMKAQVLDTLDLERERGITIKLNAVRMSYRRENGQEYELNLIDTPGHVDFTYEVSRSLAACEGRDPRGRRVAGDSGPDAEQPVPGDGRRARDHPDPQQDRSARRRARRATPGGRRTCSVSTRTRSFASARRRGSASGAARARRRARAAAGGDAERAAAGAHLRLVLRQVSRRDPERARRGRRDRKGTKITFGASEAVYEVDEVGFNQLRQVETDALGPGEVGYVVASVRSVSETRAGDTIFDAENHAAEPLPGYQAVRSFVFAGHVSHGHATVRDAARRAGEAQAQRRVAELRARDVDRAGLRLPLRFLGLLHMEIVQERLTREFDLDLVQTVPSVEYKVYKTDGTMELVENPALMPSAAVIERIEEPYVKARIMAPSEYIGPIMTLGTERRGVYKNMTYLDQQRVEFDWEFRSPRSSSTSSTS
jgi:GTP-binding protein LepA